MRWGCWQCPVAALLVQADSSSKEKATEKYENLQVQHILRLAPPPRTGRGGGYLLRSQLLLKNNLDPDLVVPMKQIIRLHTKNEGWGAGGIEGYVRREGK